MVRHDGDDPYLVVAADKGTATFSDIANGIAADYGFWLGDAFASGGSVGYDHKAMGITARGAWESVKRHFREMGVDTQSEDFTVVGVGDMSGDVFGNGMLLSEHIRLVAAFDHRHIFLDPRPTPAASFAERRRLFDLPRSSWADYDASLISAGGGVYPRTAKSIPITPEVRDALGLADDVTALTPAELMHAILAAPVDLLWNGGIGTYVKATHRVARRRRRQGQRRASGSTAATLRAKVVGEGGNLGLTQLGRIEYAPARGEVAHQHRRHRQLGRRRLLRPRGQHQDPARPARSSTASCRLADRNALLVEMTDEVAALVLTRQLRAERPARQRAAAGARRCSPCTSGSSGRWRSAASSTASWNTSRATRRSTSGWPTAAG